MERVAHIAVVVAALVVGGVLVEGAASAATPAKATVAKTAPSKSYVVKPGDGGWFQLAQSHHTTMQHMFAANHATAGTPVKAGERITLPADAKDPPKAKTASAKAPTAKRATH